MDKQLAKLEKFLLPIAEKLNGQRHLAALRDGFIAIMPLMLVGAFAVMINNVFLNLDEGSLIATLTGNVTPAEDYPGWMTFIRDVLNTISNGTLSITGVVVAFTIAYNLVEIKGYKGLEAGVISVATFFASMAIVDGTIATGFFGAANIITAIIIALVSGEIYTYLLKKDIRVKMPEGVPPAVERSFSALIPAAVILIIVAVIQNILVVTTDSGSLSESIQIFIGAPLKLIGGGAAGMYVYVTLVDVFWFFGIHGPNTLAFMDQGIFTPAAIQNADLISQGIISSREILDQAAYDALPDTGQATVYTKSLIDSFVFLGGSGATLGLVIALLIGSKVDANRKMAKYSIAPALFNINEPLLFGLPIVFNPILFIPYVIVQPILLTIALIAINIGLVPMFSITIPWTSPAILGAFLAYGGSIPAALLAAFNLVVSTIIYLPFVLIMNREAKDEGQELIEDEVVA